MTALRWVDDRGMERPCPACGAPGTKAVRLEVPSPFPGGGLLHLLSCACTSLFFDDQSLPPDYYEDHAAAVKFYVQQGAGIDHMIWPLLRVPTERIARMAEIGCGFGFALDFARTTLGWHVRGIDRSKAAQAGAQLLDLDIVPAYFEGPWSLGGETFDLVLNSEVIEHVPDPNGFVRGIADVLEPGGLAIFTTPNAAAVHPGQAVGDLLRILSPGFHLVLFTARSLRAVLEQAGFSHIRLEEDPECLRAYASRAPLEIAPFGPRRDRLYRDYLAARSAGQGLDVDLRIGFRYRLFKSLVNAGAWRDADAEFAELRDIVRERYRFDLAAPETVPTLAPVPSDLPLDLEQARGYLEEFLARVPANIVSLLHFRGSLALCTGRSDDALAFFRATARIGVVARSLRHSLANDGETADLFRRSFLLEVLALSDVAPDEAMARFAQILDGEAPDDVPGEIWDFTEKEREWLLGTLFERLVNLGHHPQAEIVYDRLRDHILGRYDLDLSRPEPRDPPDRLLDVPVPAGYLAEIWFGRGLLDLVAGRASEAVAFLAASERLLAAVAREDDPLEPVTGRAALFMRVQRHLALALSEVDADAALSRLGPLLEGVRAPDVPPSLWDEAALERRGLLCDVYVRLVNCGAYPQAASLVPGIETTLRSAAGEPPDPRALAADTDSALGATFCRAMLALNHEGAYRSAAAWFHGVYDAACGQWQTGVASPAARTLLWTARYHEALALARADDVLAATSVVQDMLGVHIAGLPDVPEALVTACRALVATASAPPDSKSSSGEEAIGEAGQGAPDQPRSP